jgi:hypothetical protein
MSHSQHDDLPDTVPPGPPDPIMGAVERLEGKIDALTAMCANFFDVVREHRREISDVRTDLDFVKRRLDTEHPPNGAGHAY